MLCTYWEKKWSEIFSFTHKALSGMNCSIQTIFIAVFRWPSKRRDFWPRSLSCKMTGNSNSYLKLHGTQDDITNCYMSTIHQLPPYLLLTCKLSSNWNWLRGFKTWYPQQPDCPCHNEHILKPVGYFFLAQASAVHPVKPARCQVFKHMPVVTGECWLSRLKPHRRSQRTRTSKSESPLPKAMDGAVQKAPAVREQHSKSEPLLQLLKCTPSKLQCMKRFWIFHMSKPTPAMTVCWLH